jgi:hypothetical protein
MLLHWDPHLMFLSWNFPSFSLRLSYSKALNSVTLPLFKTFLSLVFRSTGPKRNLKLWCSYFRSKHHTYAFVWLMTVVIQTSPCLSCLCPSWLWSRKWKGVAQPDASYPVTTTTVCCLVGNLSLNHGGEYLRTASWRDQGKDGRSHLKLNLQGTGFEDGNWNEVPEQ